MSFAILSVNRDHSFLNPYGLLPVRHVIHNPNRYHFRLLNALDFIVFLPNMIPISGGVPPFNFMSLIVWFNKKVDFELFWVLAYSIRDANPLSLLCMLQDGYSGFFDKGTRILINKTAYVLIKVDFASFFFRKTKELVEFKMLKVVSNHFYTAFFNLLMKRRPVALYDLIQN